MNNRNYNVFFHLHTVSGITISVGLFVIFFAGAFTLFREEIGQWEKGKYQERTIVQQNDVASQSDINRLFDSIEANVGSMYGRRISVYPDGESAATVYVDASGDTAAKGNALKEFTFGYDYRTHELTKEEEQFSFGTLLYLLHFYYQLDQPGYWLAGLVALFFFLAIVTGVFIHWKKIVSNFYIFRPKAKLKTIWTDAHTALGLIGLPFQFLYALTGTMFGLGIIVSSYNAVLIYDGDSQKLYDEIAPRSKDSLGVRYENAYNFNMFPERAEQQWDDFEAQRITVKNYGSTTMTVEVRGEIGIEKQFLGMGKVVFDANTGKIVETEGPSERSYYSKVWDTVGRLHYAQFGEIGSLSNYLLKIVYFLMAFITCFVIISGVLIWMEARNKKNIPEKKKHYNRRVGNIYLSLCLSMLPVTALCFVVSKTIPQSWMDTRESILNYSFFCGWLVVSVVFMMLKNNFLTNKIALLVTGVVAFFIPGVNGIVAGNWFWRTYAAEDYGIFSIDALWLLVGIVCLLVFRKLRRPVSDKR